MPQQFIDEESVVAELKEENQTKNTEEEEETPDDLGVDINIYGCIHI